MQSPDWRLSAEELCASAEIERHHLGVKESVVRVVDPFPPCIPEEQSNPDDPSTPSRTTAHTSIFLTASCNVTPPSAPPSLRSTPNPDILNISSPRPSSLHDSRFNSTLLISPKRRLGHPSPDASPSALSAAGTPKRRRPLLPSRLFPERVDVYWVAEERSFAGVVSKAWLHNRTF
jgi:hypothetical protein